MDIKQKCVSELKSLAAEIVSNAKSGHTGTAVGASSILFALFNDHLVFSPHNPHFLNRDRLVMSAGHASALYYSLLHLFGYDISSEDLKNFRKLGSKTPGHPEFGHTPGVEVSTGPLGQGIANAVGLAIAEAHLEAKTKALNQNLICNHTYCFCGDGCLMEGVAQEACVVAGTLGLGKLIILYDDNNITIDGTRELSSSEDVAKKFKAMNWNVIKVKNGNDATACSKAIGRAKTSQKPTIIIFKTTIGIDTKLAGSPKVHAHPMSAEELAEFKQTLGTNNSFGFSQNVKDFCKKAIDKNQNKYKNWQQIVENLKENNKTGYKTFKKATETSKINFENILEKVNLTGPDAGRKVANQILNLVAKQEQTLIGGAADVAASTLAKINDGGDFLPANRLGRNIHFGVREHAMGAIANGIALYCGQPVFNSTFLAFSNYMTPAVRMAAMMKIPVLSIFTHDSISVGEDGPTHQPIEQIGALRSIVGLTTFRPANNAEAVAAFAHFFETKLPTAIAISKSNFEECDVSLDDAKKGAYVLYENNNSPNVIIISTGTDTALATRVAKLLDGVSVRVVSMLCESVFASQTTYYKNKILPKVKLMVAIEATNDNLWHKYVGTDGLIFGVNAYQSSGNGDAVYKSAGFDENKIAKAIMKKLK